MEPIGGRRAGDDGARPCDPARELAASIVLQAVKDAKRGPHAAAARAWLRDDQAGRWLAALLGIDGPDIDRYLAALPELPTPAAEQLALPWAVSISLRCPGSRTCPSIRDPGSRRPVAAAPAPIASLFPSL